MIRLCIRIAMALVACSIASPLAMAREWTVPQWDAALSQQWQEAFHGNCAVDTPVYVGYYRLTPGLTTTLVVRQGFLSVIPQRGDTIASLCAGGWQQDIHWYAWRPDANYAANGAINRFTGPTEASVAPVYRAVALSAAQRRHLAALEKARAAQTATAKAQAAKIISLEQSRATLQSQLQELQTQHSQLQAEHSKLQAMHEHDQAMIAQLTKDLEKKTAEARAPQQELDKVVSTNNTLLRRGLIGGGVLALLLILLGAGTLVRLQRASKGVVPAAAMPKVNPFVFQGPLTTGEVLYFYTDYARDARGRSFRIPVTIEEQRTEERGATRYGVHAYYGTGPWNGQHVLIAEFDPRNGTTSVQRAGISRLLTKDPKAAAWRESVGLELVDAQQHILLPQVERAGSAMVETRTLHSVAA